MTLGPPHIVRVVGVGAASRADGGELAELVDEALTIAGLRRDHVSAVATIDWLAHDQRVVDLGRPIIAFSSSDLARVRTPNPSATVSSHVVTASVAEAAALLAAGPNAELVVTKRRSSYCTVAVAIGSRAS